MTDAASIGPATPPDLHVMTYNIRRRVSRMLHLRRDWWPERRALVRAILEAEQPTILGVQEALADQASFVASVLGPDHDRIGRGRNRRGDGEQCTIFYDTRRLRLDDWSQRALSDTPLKPGSHTWGNMIPRIAVSADFTDAATGARFTVINTHLDHLSRASRVRSAETIDELAADAGRPVIVMGDLNARPRSSPIRILTSGWLRDAWKIAERRLTPMWDTYSAYRPPRATGKRLDWILVTAGVEVRAIGVHAVRFDGAAASDHEPVHALVRVQPPSAAVPPHLS